MLFAVLVKILKQCDVEEKKMTVVAFIFISLLSLHIACCIDLISEDEYKTYVSDRSWSHHSCFLFHNNESSLIASFEKVSLKIKKYQHLKGFQYFQYLSSVLTLSKVVCHYGGSEPVVIIYQDVNNKLLYGWFKNVVVSLHSDVIPFINSTNLNSMVQKDDTYFMLATPGSTYFPRMEAMIKELEMNYHVDLNTHIIPPNSKIEREFVDKQIIDAIPQIQIYYRKYRYNSLQLVKQIYHDITGNQIRLTILLHRLTKQHLNNIELRKHMRDKHYCNTPSVTLMYIPSEELSYRYAHAFERTINYFKEEHKSKRIQFYLLDLSLAENSAAFSSYVDHSSPINIPYVVVTYLKQTNSGSIEVHQSSLNVVPVPYLVELHLTRLGLLASCTVVTISKSAKCWNNQTSVCGIDDYPAEASKSEIASQINFSKTTMNGDTITKSMSSRWTRGPKGPAGDLPLLTSKTWDDVFSMNDMHRSMDHLMTYKYQSSRLVLIVFVSGGCAFCEIAMKEFKKVAKAVNHLATTSMYLVNCTTSREKCRQYHVSGYPTVMLFRLLPSYRHHECIPHHLLSSPAQINYHGDFEHKAILMWLSSFTRSNLRFAKADEDINNISMKKDLLLTAAYYGRSYIQRYMSRRLASVMIPLSCFHVVCELFYAEMECVALSRDHAPGEKIIEEELYLVSMQLKRSDGFHVNIFEVDVPILRTLQEESLHSPSFRKTHQTHKYVLADDFKCERDHTKCFDFVYQFIDEHSRLAISHVTPHMFHSHQRGVHYLWRRPMLLALGYQGNFTADSTFYKSLYNVAIDMYSSMNVGILDVALFPDWAELFVPRGFHMLNNDATKDGLFSNYPRFCIVDPNEHNKAAFLPTVDVENREVVSADNLSAARLKDFISSYFKDKRSILVETDPF